MSEKERKAWVRLVKTAEARAAELRGGNKQSYVLADNEYRAAEQELVALGVPVEVLFDETPEEESSFWFNIENYFHETWSGVPVPTGGGRIEVRAQNVPFFCGAEVVTCHTVKLVFSHNRPEVGILELTASNAPACLTAKVKEATEPFLRIPESNIGGLSLPDEAALGGWTNDGEVSLRFAPIKKDDVITLGMRLRDFAEGSAPAK